MNKTKPCWVDKVDFFIGECIARDAKNHLEWVWAKDRMKSFIFNHYAGKVRIWTPPEMSNWELLGGRKSARPYEIKFLDDKENVVFTAVLDGYEEQDANEVGVVRDRYITTLSFFKKED